MISYKVTMKRTGSDRGETSEVEVKIEDRDHPVQNNGAAIAAARAALGAGNWEPLLVVRV
jgi:hypothetical protein